MEQIWAWRPETKNSLEPKDRNNVIKTINALRTKNKMTIWVRVIPQGTVDNKLGPDRLAGPKALDPNYCRQPTLWLYDLCLEVLTKHGNELRLFWAKTFPLLILLMIKISCASGSDSAAVIIFFDPVTNEE